ncbi:MAG: hypothetical protein C0442_06455 [Chlorobiaceae bacterium]|nr:hypothetical protein [Chlorobiaceae bacterium]
MALRLFTSFRVTAVEIFKRTYVATSELFFLVMLNEVKYLDSDGSETLHFVQSDSSRDFSENLCSDF